MSGACPSLNVPRLSDCHLSCTMKQWRLWAVCTPRHPAWGELDEDSEGEGECLRRSRTFSVAECSGCQ